MTQPLPRESIRNVRAHLAEVVERADRDDQEWEEREINRLIDERMANPAPGIPIEDIMRETLARGE
ncbi:prevent-host-death protein [Streptomyces venezuelae]|uniref:Prevent-host-death protein n=1 Tax=Streptomyces venezuelae TaxID=54571 RepID=A0A5P2D5Y9_STRVZ|nr:prevent-host-death protein [Streptomyces venezuelae]QES49960.1 prevent-host-death protein [Streptomyces venezuelae]